MLVQDFMGDILSADQFKRLFKRRIAYKIIKILRKDEKLRQWRYY